MLWRSSRLNEGINHWVSTVAAAARSDRKPRLSSSAAARRHDDVVIPEDQVPAFVVRINRQGTNSAVVDLDDDRAVAPNPGIGYDHAEQRPERVEADRTLVS
jgi:hypothetical protein